MKIKSKLFLGVGLLFGMIVLLTALSTIFVTKLASDSKNILVANYNTIDYARQMQIALNENTADVKGFEKFADNLKKQQANITEVGEKELTDKLAADFKTLQRNNKDSAINNIIRTDLTDIMLLNMQAIQRKSAVAENTANNAKLWIAVVGALCFLIAFSLLLNLPGNIANPVKELTESIQAIAAQNYSQRVHFEKRNEFGDLANAFNTMAQKLEEYKNSNIEKLMMEKKRIDTLINNMADPVIGVDEKSRIIFMNDVALKISGLQAAETIGKKLQDVAVHNDLIRTLAQELFKPLDEQGKEKNTPVKIYADNKESYFEKEIIPIKIKPTGETEEKLIGNVILLQNITPFKELDFAKTNFIATVSHELKTPIASIQMSLQLLENEHIGTVNDEQQNLITSIKEDAGRLLKITGELLNMTQVESGNIQMAVMPSDAQEILQYAVTTNKSAADQKKIKFETAVPESLPKVLADSEKTAWVLTNLISNAIRYSYDNAAIFIAITQEGSQLKFSVKDTGQGIAPQYKDKIFDRYFRIPGTQKEGTGLGLSISKEFIEAQGGQLTAKSEFGAGSTFSFTLNIFE